MLGVNRINDRLITVRLLVDNVTVTIFSCYVPQQGLTDAEKYDFYEKSLQLASSVDEKDILLVTGDLNGHVGKLQDVYEGFHGGFGYGSRNTEGERILEFCSALDLVLCNTFFKKGDRRLITGLIRKKMPRLQKRKLRRAIEHSP